MKRSILSGILGLATLTTLSAFGQGAISFSNFHSPDGPYNPIVYAYSVLGRPPGSGVRSTDGTAVTLWYAPVGQPLQAGPQVSWNAGYEGIGYYGYYTVTAILNGWSAGQTWQFLLVATGPLVVNVIESHSLSWTENADIVDISGTPAPPPGMSHNSIGFTLPLPEPSSATLAVFGGLLALCRRQLRAR